MNGDDRDLRERFAALRREEQAGAPGFFWPARHTDGYVRRISARMLVTTALLLAAIFAAFPWLRPLYRKSQQESLTASASPGSLSEWKPPTSFLLDTPGSKLLQTVPKIGLLQDGDGVSSSRKKDRQAGSRVSP